MLRLQNHGSQAGEGGLGPLLIAALLLGLALYAGFLFWRRRQARSS